MNKEQALSVVRSHASAASGELANRDYYIGRALKAGASIRATARAAGVSARTVQRIAERES